MPLHFLINSFQSIFIYAIRELLNQAKNLLLESFMLTLHGSIYCNSSIQLFIVELQQNVWDTSAQSAHIFLVTPLQSNVSEKKIAQLTS